eukprot:m.27640 g.27640  ORF g.27640 m.27640 type:complete len:255 (+) comp13453_c0_seq3:207-971(+)
MFSSLRRAFVNNLTHPDHGWKTSHFWGPIANWGLVGAAASDAYFKGPEVISMNMTSCLVVYSGLFMRFAWCVKPRNYLLLACHTFNVAAQTTQLTRGYRYEVEQRKLYPDNPKDDYNLAILPGVGATMATVVAFSDRLQTQLLASGLPDKAKWLIGHPAGPFTIHCWAPLMKWSLSFSNILDFNRPVENMSMMQQTALCATGFIWSRYSMVVIPKNWNLFWVNIVLAMTGSYQLVRLIKHRLEEPPAGAEKVDQ